MHGPEWPARDRIVLGSKDFRISGVVDVISVSIWICHVFSLFKQHKGRNGSTNAETIWPLVPSLHLQRSMELPIARWGGLRLLTQISDPPASNGHGKRRAP